LIVSGVVVDEPAKSTVLSQRKISALELLSGEMNHILPITAVPSAARRGA
jgi:hypothetical protein